MDPIFSVPLCWFSPSHLQDYQLTSNCSHVLTFSNLHTTIIFLNANLLCLTWILAILHNSRGHQYLEYKVSSLVSPLFSSQLQGSDHILPFSGRIKPQCFAFQMRPACSSHCPPVTYYLPPPHPHIFYSSAPFFSIGVFLNPGCPSSVTGSTNPHPPTPANPARVCLLCEDFPESFRQRRSSPPAGQL